MKLSKQKINKHLKFLLNVVVEFDETTNVSDQLVAASKIVLRDPSIKKSKKLSKNQVKLLESVLNEILNILETHEFKILYTKQSSKSYTYYFNFKPTDVKGNEWEYEVNLQFEVRDHVSKTHTDHGWTNDTIYTYSFYVGDKKCFNVSGLVNQISTICDHLKQGDYSDLEEFYDN